MYQIETDQWSEPYWKAAAEHRLVLPRCTHCGTFRMPAPFCHECQSQDIVWVEQSGDGAIYSFSVVDYPVISAVKESLPYVPALIELADAPGVRLISNVVDSLVDDIAIGAQVSLTWQDIEGGSIPRFRLKG
jgi:uncharacterized OB-fold protein